MAIKKSNAPVRVKKKSKGNAMKKKKSLVVTQEIRFARLLANSDKKVSDKVLKSLQKWLTACSESNYAFTESGFLRIWKGLFYCMWLSDKPLVQEETAEKLSNLVHCFKSMDSMLLYTKSTFKSLSSHWFGFDKYRVDKFEMLLRKITRQTFVVFKNQEWAMNYIKGFSKNLEEFLLDTNSSLGMILQVIEIFMEELAKISEGNIPTDVVTELLRPFAMYMVSRSEDREIKPVMKNIFRHLIFQSDVGLEYQDKFQAWKAAGFPCGSIKDVQKIELSDEECSDIEEEDGPSQTAKSNTPKHLDPRAGKVDVELPQIPFDAKQIIDLLTEYKFHKSSKTRARKQILRLISEFEELSQGEMPLGVKEVSVPQKIKSKTLAKQAAVKLLEFESDLYADSFKNKRRKRKSSEANSNDDSAEEETTLEPPKKGKKNGGNKKQKRIINETEDSTLIEKPTKRKFIEKSKQANPAKTVGSKKKKLKTGNTSLINNSFVVEDIGDCDKKVLLKDTSKCNSPEKWDVSENAPSTSQAYPRSMTPVIEKLDMSRTDFLKEILRRNEIVQKSQPKSPCKSPAKSPPKSNLITPTKAILSTPRTKVLNPMATRSKSETKKTVKIMLQRNTSQHTSEYLRQLKQSPSIPFDANRKPLTSVLKASSIPSPINPFYKRNSL